MFISHRTEFESLVFISLLELGCENESSDVCEMCLSAVIEVSVLQSNKNKQTAGRMKRDSCFHHLVLIFLALY